MRICDLIDIPDENISDLFYKGLQDVDVDETDLEILKGFYTLKFNRSDPFEIKFSDLAEYLASLHSDSNCSHSLLFGYFFDQIESRASRLLDLPFSWNLNSEMDTIIKNGKDDKVIEQIKNYRENGGSGILSCNFIFAEMYSYFNSDGGGSGILSCNFIFAEMYSYFNSDGSVFKFLISPPAPLDDLFYKALNIK